MLAELTVPCRQCENCLRRRAAHWRLRCQAEYNAAARTWFGTLTLHPAKHFEILAYLRAYWAKALDPEDRDFDAFPAERQFAERHAVISKEITKYVKRLREAAEGPLRLVCVAEAHISGLPHYHMLVHEADPSGPIRHAALKSRWQWGFSDWRLVTDAKAASYVTKYLSKSARARVRASSGYGTPSQTIALKQGV